MPDSLSAQELRRTEPIYPDPPYAIHPWNYSYWLGDAPGSVAQARQEYDARHRHLRPAAPPAPDRSRVYENMSRKQPYAWYGDVELKPTVEEDDGWPYQSYYYLMDFGMGQVALQPGMTLVPGQMIRVGGRTFRVKARGPVTVPKAPGQYTPPKGPRPAAGTTFVSLEGLGQR